MRVKLDMNLIGVAVFGRIFIINMPFNVEPACWRYRLRQLFNGRS